MLAERSEEIFNRYRNSVTWVDSLIGELVESARAELGQDLIVVVTGDHGEEFWEHGLLGHGAPRYVEERTDVPLLLCIPGVRLEAPAVSQHVDIWPTVFQALGVEAQVEQWSTGHPFPSASASRGTRSGSEADAEARYVGGLDFPWRHDTAAFVDAEGTLWVRACAGPGFCVEPFQATDASGQPAPLDEVARRMASSVRAFSARFERFVTLR